MGLLGWANVYTLPPLGQALNGVVAVNDDEDMTVEAWRPSGWEPCLVRLLEKAGASERETDAKQTTCQDRAWQPESRDTDYHRWWS
jgi:hypothetical protein